MEFVQGMINLDAPGGASGLNWLGELQDFYGHKKTWKTLGEVIAVDLFVGNTDRFDPTNHGKPIQNDRNVFLCQSGAVGLDFLDPHSGFNDLYDSNVGGGWYCHLLNDGAQLKTFSEALVTTMYSTITINVGRWEKYKWSKYILKGIKEGTTKLWQAIKSPEWNHPKYFVTGPSLPELASRGDLLGW